MLYIIARGVRVVFLEHMELLAIASRLFSPNYGPLFASLTLFCSILACERVYRAEVARGAKRVVHILRSYTYIHTRYRTIHVLLCDNRHKRP